MTQKANVEFMFSVNEWLSCCAVFSFLLDSENIGNCYRTKLMNNNPYTTKMDFVRLMNACVHNAPLDRYRVRVKFTPSQFRSMMEIMRVITKKIRLFDKKKDLTILLPKSLYDDILGITGNR